MYRVTRRFVVDTVLSISSVPDSWSFRCATGYQDLFMILPIQKQMNLVSPFTKSTLWHSTFCKTTIFRLRFIWTLTEAHPKLELNLWDFSTEPDDCFLDLTLSLKPSFPGTGAWIFCPCKSVSMVLIYCSIFVGVSSILTLKNII